MAQIKDRFYGFYLVACEDLGMKPQLLAEEMVDQAAAKQAALDWLAQIGPSMAGLTADAQSLRLQAALNEIKSVDESRTHGWLLARVRM